MTLASTSSPSEAKSQSSTGPMPMCFRKNPRNIPAGSFKPQRGMGVNGRTFDDGRSCASETRSHKKHPLQPLFTGSMCRLHCIEHLPIQHRRDRQAAAIVGPCLVSSQATTRRIAARAMHEGAQRIRQEISFVFGFGSNLAPRLLHRLSVKAPALSRSYGKGPGFRA